MEWILELLGVLLFFVVGIALLLGVSWAYLSYRARKMRAARPYVDAEYFRNEFSGPEYTPRAIDAAYANLTAFTRFPVIASDRLKKIGIYGDDLDDLGKDQFREWGASDMFEASKNWDEGLTKLVPPITVRDYVRFFSEVDRRLQAKNSAS